MGNKKTERNKRRKALGLDAEKHRRNKKKHLRNQNQRGLRQKKGANRLEKGGQILSQSHHHHSMKELKTRNGEAPDRDHLTLSRICPANCTTMYWGHQSRGGRRHAYALCTDPKHYTWETREDNRRRESVVPLRSGLGPEV